MVSNGDDDIVFDEQENTLYGIPDARIKVENKFQVLFECKIDAPLTKEQLEKYQQLASYELDRFNDYAIVVVTRRPGDNRIFDEVGDPSHVFCVDWSRIYEFFKQFRESGYGNAGLVRHVLELMERRGIAPVQFINFLEPSVAKSIQVFVETNQNIYAYSEMLKEYILNAVHGISFIRYDNWLRNGGMFRISFKRLQNRKYNYDSVVSFDFKKRQVDIGFYLLVRE